MDSHQPVAHSVPQSRENSLMTDVPEQELIDIYMNWWNECRTCSYWGGNLVDLSTSSYQGTCAKNGPHKDCVVGSNFGCNDWDPIHYEIALAILDDE